MTFTILARDPGSAYLGVATASRSLAVGATVPALDPAVGAVASQSWTNPALRHHALAALRAGDGAAAVIEQIPTWDDGARWRQVGVLPIAGPGAAWTGPDCSAHHAQWVGDGVVVLGNLLADPGVVPAMAEGFREATAALREGEVSADDGAGQGEREALASCRFARALLRAMRAGEAAGGDVRGRQSAAVQVARAGGGGLWPPQLGVDLRVDDDADPLGELERLLAAREGDLQASKGVTAPSTTVSSSQSLAHQCGVEQV